MMMMMEEWLEPETSNFDRSQKQRQQPAKCESHVVPTVLLEPQ